MSKHLALVVLLASPAALAQTDTKLPTNVPPENVPSEGAEAAPAVPVESADDDSAVPPDGTPADPALPTDGTGPLGKLPPRAPDEEPVARLDGDVTPPSGGVMSPFLDTRLSFSFSDDNWLSGPGETSPSSPNADFFPRSANRFFFDALNRRDSGYETMTHLVMYRRQQGFLPGLDTEAGLVIRFQLLTDDDTGRLGSSFRDDGSYVRVRYFFGGDTSDEKAPNIDLVMFPFTTERFRLGYLYDISWGGGAIFPARGVAAPGFKMQVSGFDAYAYVGAKTARLLDENINEIQSYWGVLTGAGYDVLDVLQIDVGGGYFQRGTNPLAGVEGAPVDGFGGSTRLTLHLGREVPSSIDFRLYRHDPALVDLFRASSSSRKGTSFLASLEYSLLGQTLQDTSSPQSTTIQPAQAGALSLKYQWDDLALGSDVIYRDLAFILFNRPGFVPFQAFPKDAVVSPELLLALSASYFVEALHLTPGIVLGMQSPSTFVGLDPGTLGNTKVEDLSSTQVVVVRNIGSVDILPCAEFDDPQSPVRRCVRARQAEPIYALRLALKWDVSTMLSLVGETTFLVDNNEARIEDNTSGIATRRQFSNFDPGFPILPLTSAPYNVQLAGGVFAQARF